MKKIAIFGAGGFGREVQMLIEQINSVKAVWEFIGYFDDGAEKDSIVNNSSVLGGLTELNSFSEDLSVVLAIGSPAVKKKIYSGIRNNYVSYPNLIHPSALMGNSNFVSVGKGCIITAGNLITVNVAIGNHVILNLGCTVGHDTVIQDFCSFMPGCNISGEVVIESGVYVGTGAKIINQLTIGENTIIGAGAVVSKSLPANCTAVGIPAKPIKFHNNA